MCGGLRGMCGDVRAMCGAPRGIPEKPRVVPLGRHLKNPSKGLDFRAGF